MCNCEEAAAKDSGIGTSASSLALSPDGTASPGLSSYGTHQGSLQMETQQAATLPSSRPVHCPGTCRRKAPFSFSDRIERLSNMWQAEHHHSMAGSLTNEIRIVVGGVPI